jgi:hypothetical protein
MQFLNNKIVRLVLTQTMKRSPINFRPILLVPKGENPKGIAVFLSAVLRMQETGILNNNDKLHHLLKRLVELRSPDLPYYCWGYNFDWQSRDGFLLKFVPNIICTTFAGNALIDVYTKLADVKYLNMAISAGNFILGNLGITSFDDGICFSYTPLDKDQVHNANLLGAAFLSRLYSHTGEKKFFEPASSAARYSANRQQEDGSWVYGEGKKQQWVDNFHTGYNLCALRNIGQYLKTNEFEPHIHRGFEFYRNHFFRDDGAPKYFHNKAYPLDIHSVAQSIITLTEFRDLDPDNIALAGRVLKWAIDNMWDDRGYFYYQVTPYYKNKISYMRWSQAWMLLALATLLKYSDESANLRDFRSCVPDSGITL